MAAGVLVPGTAAQAADTVDTGLTGTAPQAPAPLPKPSLPARPPAAPQAPAPPKVTVPSTPVPAPVVTPPRTPTPPAPPVKISTPPVTPPAPKPVKPPVVGQPPASAPPPVPPVQPPTTTPPPVQVPPVQVPPVGTPQPPVVTPPKVDPPVAGQPPQVTPPVVTPPKVQVPVPVSTPRTPAVAPGVAAAQTVTAASSSPVTVAGGRLIPAGSKAQPITTLGGTRPGVAGRLPGAVEVDRSPAPEPGTPGSSTPTQLTPLAIRNVITSTSPGELAHAYARPVIAAGSPLRRRVPVIERRQAALTFIPVVPTARPTAMRALRLRLAAAPARAATARVPAGDGMAVTWAMIATGSLGLILTVLMRRQQTARRRRY